MEQRIAVVTAGAAGIGRSIATRLKEDGFTVVVTDVSAEAVEDAAKSGLHAHVADASSPEDTRSLADFIQSEFGKLDVLVNNAGIAGPTARVEDIELCDWNLTMSINITAQFLHVKALLPLLRKAERGRIINLSSAAGVLGMYGRSVYSASKSAVFGFTKSLAIELGPEGITANAICPGAVGGPRIDAVIAAKAEILGDSVEAVAADYRNQSAIGEFIDPASVAGIVSFLAGPDGKQMNGQMLSVDGFTQKLF
ncbi:SDR family oxidoreductase [Brevibacterium ravenspurgense]|uniref:SDR family oxidoreductase n=1 Tax=Brevibacterium ravenspurgense TaxID=479117 RepID=UPI001EF2200C|nr:SDR family oxidoreductase [Brevibacterium ravenspurgense]MCG7301256.1 SDR family oxidoreductase [Brevibacterium ravenspurgense]